MIVKSTSQIGLCFYFEEMKKLVNEIGLEENFIYDIANGIDVFICSAYKQVDYKKVFELAMQQRIFPTVYNYLHGKIDPESFILFEKEKLRLKLKNTVLRHQIKSIVSCFQEHDIKFAISKGLAFANEIYEIPFLRDMNDIDIVISSDDYIKGCELLESLGYNLADSPKNKTEYYEANRSQCTFVKNGSISVELKDKIQYVRQEDLDRWFDRVEYKEISGLSIPVFCIQDMFINILVNSNKNMSNPYGIDNDYRIRDILELYLFIIKNKSVFTNEYVSVVIEPYYLTSLSCMMDYFEEFFTKENFEKIPLCLKQARIDDYGIDHVKWKSSIVTRLFNTEQRICEHHLFRFEKYSKDNSRTTFIANGEILNLNLSDYAKNHNIKVTFSAQSIDNKVTLNFEFENIKKSNEYHVRVRIADPSTIDSRAYRTDNITLKNDDIVYTSENDVITYNEAKSRITILCDKNKILFDEEGLFYMSFLLNEKHSKHVESQRICSIGGNIRLRKFILTN